MRLGRILGLLALMLCLPSSASGQPDAALRHFEQGEAFFRAGAFDKAAEEYVRAYELSEKPGLLFNAGLASENAEALQSAVEYYERYLTAEPEGVKSAEARARLEVLRRRLASSTMKDAQPPNDSGAANADTLPDGAQASATTAGSVAPTNTRPALWPGLSLLGGAAAVAGVGLYFHLDSQATADDLERLAETGAPPLDSRDPRLAEGRSRAQSAAVLFGVAGVLAVGGAILTVRAWASNDVSTTNRKGDVSLVPIVGTGQALVAIEGLW